MRVILESISVPSRQLTLIREKFGDTISLQIRHDDAHDKGTPVSTVTVDAVQLRRAVAILAIDAEYDPDGMETM